VEPKALEQVLDILISDANAPLPLLLFDDFNLDDLSDLNSVIPNISSSAVSNALFNVKLVANVALPLPLLLNNNKEDKFKRDLWNTVTIMGLRVYYKGSGVTVKVVRPRD
jgi:hypothetical protein